MVPRPLRIAVHAEMIWVIPQLPMYGTSTRFNKKRCRPSARKVFTECRSESPPISNLPAISSITTSETIRDLMVTDMKSSYCQLYRNGTGFALNRLEKLGKVEGRLSRPFLLCALPHKWTHNVSK